MLVQSAATNAYFRVKHTREVHIHANNLDAWQQEYEQTSPGVFHGEVRELFDGNLQVFEEVANCATSQHCRSWADGLWVGLAVSEKSEGLRFMGRPTNGLQLMLARGDDPFDLQVPADQGLYGMVFSREELAQHIRDVHHRDWLQDAPSGWSGAPRMQALNSLQRLRLVGILREVLRSLQGQPEVLQHEASRRTMREALLTVLGDTLLVGSVSEAASPRQLRRQKLVNRVRELVLESPHTPLNIQALCAELHVTRRTLQNCFQDVLGLSPVAYLRAVRLNAVRRALRDETDQTTIADMAARWGFWHMGHFSHEYKVLFGETPSQTRLGRASTRLPPHLAVPP